MISGANCSFASGLLSLESRALRTRLAARRLASGAVTVNLSPSSGRPMVASASLPRIAGRQERAESATTVVASGTPAIDVKLPFTTTARALCEARPGNALGNCGPFSNSRTEFFERLDLRGDLGSDFFPWLAIPKADVDWGPHIEPSCAVAPRRSPIEFGGQSTLSRRHADGDERRPRQIMKSSTETSRPRWGLPLSEISSRFMTMRLRTPANGHAELYLSRLLPAFGFESRCEPEFIAATLRPARMLP